MWAPVMACPFRMDWTEEAEYGEVGDPTGVDLARASGLFTLVLYFADLTREGG